MNKMKLLKISISSLLLILAQGCKSDINEIPDQVQEELSVTSEILMQEEATETSESSLEVFQPIYGNLEFDGDKRYYFVYLPENYSSSSKFPLVIYLHSYGWTPKQGMNYTMLHQVADANDFVMVFPSGNGNWNSGIGDNSRYPTPDMDDVGFLNALIDTLSNVYSLDLERVYATGYSNGGVMAYKLACQLSDRIAAIASVAGSLSTSTFEDCDPKRPVPILHIHGTEDPWIPIEGIEGLLPVEETLDYWIEFNRCKESATDLIDDSDPSDNSSAELHSYRDCSDGSIVIFYKVIDGGHTWPGAGPAGYPTGFTNQDFDAGMEIWNFFEGFRLTLPSENN